MTTQQTFLQRCIAGRVVAAVAVVCGLAVAPPAWAQSGAPRGYLTVGFGNQAATKAFTDTWTATVNVEEARYQAQYGKKGGSLFDIGGGARLVRQLYVGVALTRTKHSSTASVSASVPHPFFFNRNREATGTASDLERSELGTHLQVSWRQPVGNALVITLFGGPSWVKVEQDLVETIAVIDTFPYDVISLGNPVTGLKSGTGVGGHVGVDVSYRLGSSVAVGGQVRMVSAEAKANVGADRSATLKAGGVAATGGLRVSF